MSTDQEYWDACLIKTWRKGGSVLDALQLFASITGKRADEIEPRLLRLPRLGYKYKLPVRIFMAEHLEKISNRLFEQAPEKDIALLRKLKDSKYDTSEKTTQTRDSELAKTYARNRRDNLRVGFFKVAFGFDNRNSATDWNKVK